MVDSKLIAALIFPIGLMCVIFSKSELFTGNCLYFIPILKEIIPINRIIKSWVIVYIGNAIGAILIAIIIYASGLPIEEKAAATYIAKTSLPIYQMFLKGILCNILVCIAVWFGIHVKEHIVGVYLPVFLFVLCGLEHSIANWYFLTIGMMYDGYRVGFLTNILAVTVGNMVGGFIISWFLSKKE